MDIMLDIIILDDIGIGATGGAIVMRSLDPEPLMGYAPAALEAAF